MQCTFHIFFSRKILWRINCLLVDEYHARKFFRVPLSVLLVRINLLLGSDHQPLQTSMAMVHELTLPCILMHDISSNIVYWKWCSHAPSKETADNSFRALHRYKRASCLVSLWFNHRLITKLMFISSQSALCQLRLAHFPSYDISDNYPLHVEICPSAILKPSPLVTAIFSFGTSTFSFIRERTLPFSPQQEKE